MTRTVPRKQRKAETRKALKTAAMRCFEEHGFRETSIGAITGMAGVAHGTFYVHFESKDALLDELLAEFYAELVGGLAPVWSDASTTSLPAQLRQTAALFLEHWATHRGFVEIYAQKVAQGISVAQLTEGLAPAVAALMVVRLQTLAEEHGAELPEAEVIVPAMLALWARVGLQHLFTDHIDREQAVDLLTRMSLGALQGVLPALAEAWSHEESRWS